MDDLTEPMYSYYIELVVAIRDQFYLRTCLNRRARPYKCRVLRMVCYNLARPK
jgi:hypothetical protein